MSIEQNKALMYRWFDLCTTTSDMNSLVNVMDDFYTSDYIVHRPGSPDIQRGTEVGDKHFMETVKDISDFHGTVLDMVGEDEKVAVRVKYDFTQSSTGERLSFSSLSILRFVNGKMAEEWEYILPVRELA